MKINQAFSLRIREILKQKRMSQYQLEMRSGLYHSTLSCFLNCRYSSANIKTIFLIIQALDITILEFFDSPLFNDINTFELD